MMDHFPLKMKVHWYMISSVYHNHHFVTTCDIESCSVSLYTGQCAWLSVVDWVCGHQIRKETRVAPSHSREGGVL